MKSKSIVNKLVSDIAAQTRRIFLLISFLITLVDKRYIMEILDHQFGASLQTAVVLEFTQEDFLRMLEGRVGDTNVIKRMYQRLFHGDAAVLPVAFFKGLDLLENGKPTVRLKCLNFLPIFSLTQFQ